MDSLPQEILQMILTESATCKANYISLNLVCKNWNSLSAKIWYTKKKAAIKNYVYNINNLQDIKKISKILSLFSFPKNNIKMMALMLEKSGLSGDCIDKKFGYMTKNYLLDKYSNDPKKLVFISEFLQGMRVSIEDKQEMVLYKGVLYENDLFINYDRFSKITYSYVNSGNNELNRANYSEFLVYTNTSHIEYETFEEIMLDIAKYNDFKMVKWEL
jgi:hypothetical protein